MKWVNVAAYNLVFSYISSNANELYLCTTDITDVDGVPQYSLITGSEKLAGPVAMVPGNFTVSDAADGGRVMEIVGQADVLITAAGRVDNLVLLDSGVPNNNGIVLVTSFSYGNAVVNDRISFDAFSYELPMPY